MPFQKLLFWQYPVSMSHFCLVFLPHFWISSPCSAETIRYKSITKQDFAKLPRWSFHWVEAAGNKDHPGPHMASVFSSSKEPIQQLTTWKVSIWTSNHLQMLKKEHHCPNSVTCSPNLSVWRFQPLLCLVHGVFQDIPRASENLLTRSTWSEMAQILLHFLHLRDILSFSRIPWVFQVPAVWQVTDAISVVRIGLTCPFP